MSKLFHFTPEYIVIARSNPARFRKYKSSPQRIVKLAELLVYMGGNLNGSFNLKEK